MQLEFDFCDYFIDIRTKLIAKALDFKHRNLIMYYDVGLKHSYFCHVNNLWRCKK